MAAVALAAGPYAGRHLAAAEPLLSAEAPPAERDALSGVNRPRFLDPPAQAALDAALEAAMEKTKVRPPTDLLLCDSRHGTLCSVMGVCKEQSTILQADDLHARRSQILKYYNQERYAHHRAADGSGIFVSVGAGRAEAGVPRRSHVRRCGRRRRSQRIGAPGAGEAGEPRPEARLAGHRDGHGRWAALEEKFKLLFLYAKFPKIPNSSESIQEGSSSDVPFA